MSKQKSDQQFFVVARNERLTYDVEASIIYVSPDGEVVIVADSFNPYAIIPDLSADYLDALCSHFYYGGYEHQDAIADILLLNGVLTRDSYDDFYASLRDRLSRGEVIVISGELSGCP